MAIKITLKNSVVQDSVPTTSHLAAVGELALNANINSLGIYMRASDNSIVKMAGPGSVTTPAASVTVAGIAELATSAETTTGTDTARVTTPAGVKAVTDAERTTSNSTYLAKAGGTLTGVLAATAGSNSAASIHFGDTDSGLFGGTNTVSLTAGGTTRLTADTGVSVTGALSVSSNITTSGGQITCGVVGTSGIQIINDGTFGTLHSADLVLRTVSTERARLDTSGRLLVGLTSARTLNSGYTPSLQVEGNTATTSSISAINNVNQTGGPSVWLGKSRGAALGGVTTVQSGDELGSIFFNGADGTDIQSIGASIVAKSNGTVAGNRMPGELLFATTADSAGSVAPTTRLTITSAGLVNVPDNGKFTAGSSNDLTIDHDAAHSNITNTTGNLHIRNSNETNIQNLDGSENRIKTANNGAVELYYDNSKKLETTSYGSAHTGVMRFENSGDGISLYDSRELKFGNGDDLKIYHDGDSYITNTTATQFALQSDNLRLRSTTGNENYIVCTDEAGVGIYWDGSKKFETTAGGTLITGTLGTSGTITGGGHIKTGSDTGYFLAGASNDLQLYHDGNNSKLINSTGYLQLQTTSGILYLDGNNTYIRSGDGAEYQAKFIDNGAAELYYDGSKIFNTETYGAIIKRASGGATVLEIFGCEGNNAEINLKADDGDDNADRWKIKANAASSSFAIQDYGSGSWISKIECNGGSVGGVELYYGTAKKLETTDTGVAITGVLNTPAGIGPQIRFENQVSGVTADAAISTFDDASGTLLAIGSNFYFDSSGSENRYNTSEESAGITINRTGSINLSTGGTGATATSRFSINSDGQIGINTTPDTAGGLVQIRNNMEYTDGTTNLLTSASKAAFRIRTSSNSSKSLYIGGIDETGNPYLQVGNLSTGSGGATATYDLNLQPYGGIVSIGDSTPETWPTLQVHKIDAGSATSFLLRGNDLAQILLRDETGGTNEKVTTIRNDQGDFLVGTHNDAYSNWQENIRIKHAGGITFNGDTSADNALDDYEEGTWTPTFLGSTGNPTMSGHIAAGIYTKVGNLVTVTYYSGSFTLSGSPGGTPYIGGLPFAAKSTGNNYSTAYFAHTTCFNADACGYVNNGGSLITVLQTGDTTAGNTWESSGTKYLMVHFTYLAA